MKKEHKSSFRGKVGDNAKKAQRSGGGGFAYLNVPKGVPVLLIPENTRKVKLDFIPYVVTDKKHPDRDDKNEVALPESLWYKRPFLLHRSIGVDNKNYICLKSIGKACPICEAQAAMWDKDHDGAVSLYPKDRFLYAVVPIDLEKFEEVPHVWEMSKTLFQDVLKDELEEDVENEVFPDLEEGKTLTVSFKWKTIGEKGKPFPEAKSIVFEDRDAYKESILDDVPDLDQIIHDSCLSYDELKDIFFGIDKEEEDEPKSKKSNKKDDDDEDEPPTRHRSREVKEEEKPARSKRAEKEEEPEEEEETTWDDLEAMNQSKLERFCKTNKLKINIDDYDDDVSALRKVIAKALDIDIPKPKKKAEPEEEEEDEKPTRTRSAGKSERTKKASDNDCPSGYKFGIDTDKHDECDSCDVWDKCIAAKEKSKK